MLVPYSLAERVVVVKLTVHTIPSEYTRENDNNDNNNKTTWCQNTRVIDNEKSKLLPGMWGELTKRYVASDFPNSLREGQGRMPGDVKVV